LRERWQWKSFVEQSATEIVANSATESNERGRSYIAMFYTRARPKEEKK
jgi:hypothetical protein